MKKWEEVIDELVADVQTGKPAKRTLATLKRIGDVLEYWRGQEISGDVRPPDCSSALLLAWITGETDEHIEAYRDEAEAAFGD